MTSAEEVETISEKLEVIIYLDDNPKISDLLETTATLLRTLLKERDEAVIALANAIEHGDDIHKRV